MPRRSKKLCELVNYTALRQEQDEARKQGRLMGIGISTYGEICAIGPSPATPAGGWESATVKIEPTGKVTVMTGVSPHGQGEETTFAQIAADELGVGIEDVIVLHGDTAIVQYGIGTFGSRGTAIGGTAMYFAIQELKEKIKKYGAMLLGSDDVTFADGKCTDNKTGESKTLAEIAGAIYRAMKLPPNTQPGMVATYFWEPPNFTFPFGAHIVITEVDRETGEIEIKRYVAVDDCGKIINPLIVDGQVHGGVAQGLGQALWEHAVYDDDGQLVTGEFMDYAIPARDAACRGSKAAHTETPSPVNPLGVKGVGEAGTIGCSPAVVNSVVDALSPLGVRHIDMPLTPEKIWKLVTGSARMIPQNFEYAAPATLDEALGLLANENAKALAGGMSLIPDDEAALRRAGTDRRSRPPAGAELHSRRRRRNSHRRHDHALRDRELGAVAR